MRRFVGALASFVTGRRTKWVVLAFWIVLAFAFSPLGAKLADETQDDTASFLPESAESTEVVELLDDALRGAGDHPGPDRLPARRRADSGRPAKIEDDAAAIVALGEEEVPLVRPPTVPFTEGAPPELVSDDGRSPTRS